MSLDGIQKLRWVSIFAGSEILFHRAVQILHFVNRDFTPAAIQSSFLEIDHGRRLSKTVRNNAASTPLST